MASDSESILRIYDWVDDKIIGMRTSASMIPYRDMALKPPTHLVALYPDGELLWAFPDPTLNAAIALGQAKRLIMTTNFSEAWVQEAQANIKEYYPEIFDREQLLLSLALRMAATYRIPLLAILFGFTLESHEPVAILHTQSALRIDRALALLRQKIQELGV
jgi:hypothetical protein